MTSPSKHTILIDCDSVLVEHNDLHIDKVNEVFGTSYTFESITSFGYDFMTHEQRELTYELWRDPTLYDDAELTQEQLVTLERLRKLARLVVVTSPMVGSVDSKYAFLLKYFDRHDILTASDKSIIRGDILIDDSQKNLDAFPNPVIIFDKPWNQQVLDGWRCFAFKDLPIIAQSILCL